MTEPSIYSWIQQEESKFETQKIKVGDNWHWSFRDHIQLIFHLKNGVFYTGENNWLRAFKNIMEPILQLAYWSEDIELKDVLFYIESKNGRALSFLVKKYHDEVYVRENDLDKMFDDITESDLDYGGALVQMNATKRPQVLKLKDIAFCDQSDILGGPVGFKMNFTPSKLRKMSKLGWGEEKNGATVSIQDLITMAEATKNPTGNQSGKNDTTGKNIEVYIVRGDLPEHYLLGNDNMEDYYSQVQINAFYRDEKDNKIGVTLYRKKEEEGNLKFFTSKEVEDRALGRGVGEAITGPQIWTNFLTIHKTAMLEAGSKVPLYTDDPAYTQRNKIQDMENLEITTIEDGKRIYQVPTVAPANIQLYEKSINEWYEHAQFAGSAQDPMLGKEESSGTTFRGQERLVQMGRGIHDRRRGQRAKFIEELYRDKENGIIKGMTKKMFRGHKFLATLTSDEMTWVSDQLAECYAGKEIKEDILNGKTPRDKEELKQEYLKSFTKNGDKHLTEILEGEFEDVEIKMGINIAGKQKNLAQLSDKLLSIFQFVIANPPAFQQAMQIPGLAKSFNEILEFGGLSQVDFAALTAMKPLQDLSQQPQQQPMQPPQMPQQPQLQLA